jgi:hypothetical protein
MIQIDPVRLERDENDLLALDPRLPLRLSENREIRDFAQRNLALHLGRIFYIFNQQPKAVLCIGILNHLFFWPEQYRRTGRMSIVFLFDENPDVASAGSGGAAVGGARSVPDHAARSNSERAAPSARVGNRFSAPQIVWNRSNRCAGERGGARVGRPRWARILTITGGSSMPVLSLVEGAAMIFKLPPQFGQCSMSMSKTRLSSRAQLMRGVAP